LGQTVIVENRALGECVPPGTEIYTRDGWKNIEDIAEDEIIFTMNTTSNETQLQRITKKVVLPFDGHLFRIKNNRSFDMCITPNHKMLMWNRNNEQYTMTASDFYEKWLEKDSGVSHSCLKRAEAELNGETHEIVHQHVSESMGLDFRFLNVTKVEYKGDVFCVTVPNGTWLMRYNGKVCWTHNCDHPDSSVVNLKNVSHIIREAYFDGDTVFGTIELLNTPSGKIVQSLVESKVKLGISSRGVGTTKKQGDYHIVQDDFQLITCDIVSEPSTPAAFIIPEGKSIAGIDLRHTFNKSDRIDRILNDILSSKHQLT
jgi:hypothetical protein